MVREVTLIAELAAVVAGMFAIPGLAHNGVQHVPPIVGTYQVTLPGLGAVSGHAQVTAYGAGTTRCKVQSWNTSGAAKLVNIRCFDTAGAPADSRYVLDFVH